MIGEEVWKDNGGIRDVVPIGTSTDWLAIATIEEENDVK
jgi:hypothetical protein